MGINFMKNNELTEEELNQKTLEIAKFFNGLSIKDANTILKNVPPFLNYFSSIDIDEKLNINDELIINK